MKYELRWAYKVGNRVNYGYVRFDIPPGIIEEKNGEYRVVKSHLFKIGDYYDAFLVKGEKLTVNQKGNAETEFIQQYGKTPQKWEHLPFFEKVQDALRACRTFAWDTPEYKKASKWLCYRED